jgi:Flp pilus assembly protein protease CpaA
MNCPRCGTSNPEGSEHCFNCGASTDQLWQPSQTAAAFPGTATQKVHVQNSRACVDIAGQPVNAGEKTLDWLYREQLKVDEQWSVRTKNGFTWWPYKNAQTVEILGTEVDEKGETAYLIGVQTDFLRALESTDKTLTAINALLMRHPSMAGPVYDAKTKSLKLCSLVRIHEGIRPWMSALISMACALQISEVMMGHPFAKTLGAEPAESGHPHNGVRNAPDELASIVSTLVVPVGKQPCNWTKEEFEKAVTEYMQRPPSLLATGGSLGFTAEFLYGNESSLCRAMGDQSHPVYGNGLSVLQSFPVRDCSAIEGIRLALSLNDLELTQKPFGYGFGSYCYRDKMIQFTGFLPNAAYRAGLLPNVYFACASRAKEMSLRLRNADWTEEAFQEALARKMALLQSLGAPVQETAEVFPAQKATEAARRKEASTAAPRQISTRQQAPLDPSKPSVPSRVRSTRPWWPAIAAAVVIIGISIIIAGLKTAILASAVMLCVIGGWTDLRSGLIPDRLTLPGLVAGVVLNTLLGGWTGLEGALLGAGLGFLLLLPFFLLRSLGAGGLKLAVALGAFVGPRVLLKLLIASVGVVVVMLLSLAIHKGRLQETLRSVGRFLAALVSFRKPGPGVGRKNQEPLQVSSGAALAFTVVLYVVARGLGWIAG